MAARKPTPRRSRPAGETPRAPAAEQDSQDDASGGGAPLGQDDEVTEEMASLVAKFLGADVSADGLTKFTAAMKAAMTDVAQFAGKASHAAQVVVAGQMALKKIGADSLAAAGALQPEQVGEEDDDDEEEEEGDDDESEEEDVTVTFKAIANATDQEEQEITGVVLIPNETDFQLDIYGAKVVKKAAHNWLSRFGRGKDAGGSTLGFMHKDMNPPLELCESWIAREDCVIGGQDVKKGTWLMTVKVLSKKLWDEVKAGKWTGFSIGGKAKVRKPTPAVIAGLT